MECSDTQQQFFYRDVVAEGGRGSHGSMFFKNHRTFGNYKVSSGKLQIFGVGKDKGFEFYRKVFELGSPTLHVLRRPCFSIFVLLVIRYIENAEVTVMMMVPWFSPN